MDGKRLANERAEELKHRVGKLKSKNCNPKLTVFVSDEDASSVYVRNKVKRAEEIGIEIQTKELKSKIDFENSYNGEPFIIQMPCNLTKDELAEIESEYWENDMDGFSAMNLGHLAVNSDKAILPCTPIGIFDLIWEYCSENGENPIKGKHIVIIGRSNIVGKPLAMMLTNEGACVTICHSEVPNEMIRLMCDKAQIIISATGNRAVLQDFDFQPWQTVIDVGMNRDENGKLCGDIDEEPKQEAMTYTPVPGGVGPMTVINLMENVVEYFEKRLDK